jgi:hypothetical protein
LRTRLTHTIEGRRRSAAPSRARCG